MRVVERLRELAEDREELVLPERPRLHQRAQALAAHQLHHEVRAAILRLADVVDRRDVRMLQRCRRPRLSNEPGACSLVAHPIGREHLDRDVGCRVGESVVDAK